MTTPRLVIVHRETELSELLTEHSTLGAVEFFLRARGQSVDPLIRADEVQQRALATVAGQAPSDWRQVRIERSQLSRFLFEPDDLVAVVGQDGLIPNVSKYLTGQRVFGIGPERPGLLCRHRPEQLGGVIAGTAEVTVSQRHMVEARLDDGQRLVALNEVFLGDMGHQSARYVLGVGERHEEHSSSGLIVGTGTGATGWLASLWNQTRPGFALPGAESDTLAYFVREAWPSSATGTELTAGLLTAPEALRVRARSSLVVFGDGIESDRLRLEWGQEITVGRSGRTLNLVQIRPGGVDWNHAAF